MKFWLLAITQGSQALASPLRLSGRYKCSLFNRFESAILCCEAGRKWSHLLICGVRIKPLRWIWKNGAETFISIPYKIDFHLPVFVGFPAKIIGVVMGLLDLLGNATTTIVIDHPNFGTVACWSFRTVVNYLGCNEWSSNFFCISDCFAQRQWPYADFLSRKSWFLSWAQYWSYIQDFLVWDRSSQSSSFWGIIQVLATGHSA